VSKKIVGRGGRRCPRSGHRSRPPPDPRPRRPRPPRIAYPGRAGTQPPPRAKTPGTVPRDAAGTGEGRTRTRDDDDVHDGAGARCSRAGVASAPTAAWCGRRRGVWPARCHAGGTGIRCAPPDTWCGEWGATTMS
jgi:hypothetical protein